MYVYTYGCLRSLKRDEEITLWRSLCALRAPLYGNLCISFFPSRLASDNHLVLTRSPSLFVSRSPLYRVFYVCLALSFCLFLRWLGFSGSAFYHRFPCFPRWLVEAYASRCFSYSLLLSSVTPSLVPPCCSSSSTPTKATKLFSLWFVFCCQRVIALSRFYLANVFFLSAYAACYFSIFVSAFFTSPLRPPPSLAWFRFLVQPFRIFSTGFDLLRSSVFLSALWSWF